MNQYELRKKERYLNERYSKLLSAVKDNDIKALKKYFPTAQDFIEFNQDRRSRDEHVLEAMVKYSSPEFIKQVFSTYFPDNDEKTLELKDKFLKTTSKTGEKINYKYFAPYLPEELTDKVANSYGISKTIKLKDEQENVKTTKPQKEEKNETEEPKSVAKKIELFLKGVTEKINTMIQGNENTPKEEIPVDTRPRMEQIYDIIKKENKSLTEYRNKEIRRRHLQLRESDEKPVEHLYTSTDNSKALRIEREAIPSLFVRKVNTVDENDDSYKKDELVRIDLANNFDGTRKDLVKSLYQNADFPEDYIWAIDALKKFEREYANIISTDETNLAQLKEFAKDGGRFFIEEGQSSDNVNCENYIAFAGKREGYSVIGFDAQKYADAKIEGNSLLHELIHRADINSGEIFSQTEFFKQIAILMIAENDEGRAAKMSKHISNNYNQGDIYSELLAYMNEQGKDGLKDSKLATLVRDIYGIYTNAKIHNDTEIMKRITSYKPNWIPRHTQDMFELSNGEEVFDKEKLRQNISISTITEELDKFKESLGYKIDMDFPPFLQEKYDPAHIGMVYMDFIKEQQGIKNKDQAFENLDKWIENISKSDNEKDFLKAVTMAYCYTKSYRKTEQDIFEEANISNLSLSNKEKIAHMFREETTHLKALEIIACSKDEAILANNIDMPIKDLIACKRLGKAMIEVLKDDKDIKEYLEKMINKAREGGENKDFLILQGAVEFIGKKKGIENPLGYEIKTKDMLSVVDDLTKIFIDTHFTKKEVSQNITQSKSIELNLLNR